MSTFLIFLAIVIGFMFIRLMVALNKDSYDFQDQSLSEKFGGVIAHINDTAYKGSGTITPLDKRSFNLYQNGSNQIVNFYYSMDISQ